VRTFTDRHGLKDLTRDLLNVEIFQAAAVLGLGRGGADAGAAPLCAADVLYLHRLRERLDEMLAREGRTGLAQACFAFLPTRVELDLAGWGAEDIFVH